MAGLLEQIREAVENDRYFVTKHAAERLHHRGILMWQVVDGLPTGTLLHERPDDEPFPSVEVKESLPDGTDINAIWSLVESSGVAQLVTVHFFDR
jgi:Domain of unknown function (DUF4258)